MNIVASVKDRVCPLPNWINSLRINSVFHCALCKHFCALINCVDLLYFFMNVIRQHLNNHFLLHDYCNPNKLIMRKWHIYRGTYISTFQLQFYWLLKKSPLFSDLKHFLHIVYFYCLYWVRYSSNFLTKIIHIYLPL